MAIGLECLFIRLIESAALYFLYMMTVSITFYCVWRTVMKLPTFLALLSPVLSESLDSLLNQLSLSHCTLQVLDSPEFNCLDQPCVRTSSTSANVLKPGNQSGWVHYFTFMFRSFLLSSHYDCNWICFFIRCLWTLHRMEAVHCSPIN